MEKRSHGDQARDKGSITPARRDFGCERRESAWRIREETGEKTAPSFETKPLAPLAWETGKRYNASPVALTPPKHTHTGKMAIAQQMDARNAQHPAASASTFQPTSLIPKSNPPSPLPI